MSRPVIGICAAIEQARWGSWDSLVVLSPRTYSLAVQREGALGLVLPPDESIAAEPADVLDLLDGLLLSGGSDIDPATYGESPRPETSGGRPERDRFEIALARGAIERDIPLLGVCRGMQLLNVARGGTLDQHIDNLEVHRHTPGAFHDHEVVLEPASLAARAAGAERLLVKSHHHQGVATLGDGLVVTGRAVDDDLIEAIELPGCRFALGVLWHPEEGEGAEGPHPIAGLVRAARGTDPA
jgi:putative glutamine amidotransferase